MSDLTATNCGCGCDNGCESGCGNHNSIFGGFGNGSCGCSILWILILFGILGNGNNGCGSCAGGYEGGNSCCLIILLLLLCGGDGCLC